MITLSVQNGNESHEHISIYSLLSYSIYDSCHTLILLLNNCQSLSQKSIIFFPFSITVFLKFCFFQFIKHSRSSRIADFPTVSKFLCHFFAIRILTNLFQICNNRIIVSSCSSTFHFHINLCK